MSTVISIRVSDMEKEMLNKASAVYGCGVSSLMKKLAFEKLEDEYDLAAYEEAMAEFKKNPVTYSLDEVEKELGLR